VSDGGEVWQRACLTLHLLARDPQGLGGLVLRARAGPVRDRFLEGLREMLPGPVTRLHPAMGADTLLGGLDLTATLQSGHRIVAPGLLERPGTFVLSMAERCPPDLAALLAQALDRGRMRPLILLDEGADDDEQPPRALAERLAFHVDLDGIGLRDTAPVDETLLPDLGDDVRGAPQEDAILTLTLLAARFGIDSLRAPRFALQAARALTHLHGGQSPVGPSEIRAAAELVFPHRATRVPEPPPEEAPEDDTPPPPETQDDTDTDKGETESLELPEEMLLEAIKALLPEDLLAGLQSEGAMRAGMGSGAGQRRKGNRRGRPLPSRRGRLDGSARIDLVATLRAAAPWQKLRRDMGGTPRQLAVWPSDIHVKRYEDRSDRVLVFAVDASGSAALARLAEAKGAVELLLAQAYAQRDHVSLIAFRGDGAELLLPPTRSLVQTKRRLAALPGGGGTPLAAALQAAGEVARMALDHGLTPTLALLTDGRANIALDGTANRAQAQADAERLALWLRGLGLPTVVLDVGRRPHAPLKQLAQTLGARYLPLPRADAKGISTVLQEAMG
jgi:magnesium chelatase subunit D